MSYAADLRQFFLDQPALNAIHADRVHHNHPPETYVGTYLWFRRRGLDRERTMEDAAGQLPFRVFWDLEAISSDGNEAEDLGELVLKLDAYTGAFGGSSVQAIFIDEQTDDYVPRGFLSNQALEFTALSLEIVGYTAAP